MNHHAKILTTASPITTMMMMSSSETRSTQSNAYKRPESKLFDIVAERPDGLHHLRSAILSHDDLTPVGRVFHGVSHVHSAELRPRVDETATIHLIAPLLPRLELLVSISDTLRCRLLMLLWRLFPHRTVASIDQHVRVLLDGQ